MFNSQNELLAAVTNTFKIQRTLCCRTINNLCMLFHLTMQRGKKHNNSNSFKISVNPFILTLKI